VWSRLQLCWYATLVDWLMRDVIGLGDLTSDFTSTHLPPATPLLPPWLVQHLCLSALQTPASLAAEKGSPPGSTGSLSPEEWRAFKLVKKEQLTSNTPVPTYLFRFALPDKHQVRCL
jgi:hypothetical protein